MFSQQQAVVRVSTSFSSVRLAPPPTHGLQISPAGLSLLLLPKGEPSATLQQCSYGLVLELQLESCRCLYSPSCLERLSEKGYEQCSDRGFGWYTEGEMDLEDPLCRPAGLRYKCVRGFSDSL